MAKKARSAAYKKSYASGKKSAIAKGIYVSKALKREIKAIAKSATETVAEKKEMGAESPITYNIDPTFGNNSYLCVPPTYLGLQAYQRVGAHIRCHGLRLKVQGFITFAIDVPKAFPNGVYIDVRVFSIKGLRSAQDIIAGNVAGAFSNSISEYKYNINTVQTPGSVNQYGPISGEWNDDFCKVNEEMITEHYKTSILLDTFYTLQTTYPSKTQHTKSAFQKYINLTPFIAKQWKYDPDSTGTAPSQTGVEYPNNVALFVVTTWRNPSILTPSPPAITGSVKYCTMGTFSDV